MSHQNNYFWYMTCLFCFVAPLGIQTVLFPWLVVVELEGSGARLGFAQFCLQLPAIFLILLGGLLADRFNRAKILMICHGFAVLPALGLAYAISTSQLSYASLLVYALAIGTVTAFVQPARDGMLNQIATDDLQKGVTISMGLTFGGQFIGFMLGGAAETVGPRTLLLVHSALMALGIICAVRLLDLKPAKQSLDNVGVRPPGDAKDSGLIAIQSSLIWVRQSPAMLPVMFLVFAMSFLYGGAYMVLVPIITRDVYGGGASEIAQCFMAFVAGTVFVTGSLVKIGGLNRPLQGLQIALFGGGLCLIAGASVSSFNSFLWILVAWGGFGAVAMSMARTLIQEAAPEHLRSRVLAIFSLANMGGMPMGGLILGSLSVVIGGEVSLWIVSISMFSVLAFYRWQQSQVRKRTF
ncbi:MAG: MFS transporter [Pseudomonadales bacterium]